MAKKKSKKKIKFSGRIVNSKYDFQTKGTDVGGPHYVIYPKSASDVSAALALSKDIKTFVRSGENVAKHDAVDGAGGVVINLKEMSDIAIKNKLLKAQAAATSEAIMKSLAEHELAIPLSDNPHKSIASDLLFESRSYLNRSLGSLSDYVSTVRAVKPDGKAVTIKNGKTATILQQCKDVNAVITEIGFEPVSAKGLWMFRATFPYPGEESFRGITKRLFRDTKFTKQLGTVFQLIFLRFSTSGNLPIVFAEIIKEEAKCLDMISRMRSMLQSVLFCQLRKSVLLVAHGKITAL